MPRGRIRKKAGIYPNLEAWRRNNGKTVVEFTEIVGVNHSTLYKILNGEVGCTKYTIDRILEVTGMTYEEAFKEVEA